MSIFPAKVMFADDDPSMRILIRESLEQVGFTVCEASSGNELLELLDVDRPEVILLDVMMPGIDGYAVCQEIRKRPEGKYIPILLVTGRDDAESINMAYDVGGTDFISKPINWELLGHRVKHLLRSGRVQKELFESQVNLEYAQKISKVGSWNWLKKDDVVEFSSEAERILGLSEVSTALNLSGLVNRIHVDDKEKFLNCIETCQNEMSSISVEYRIVHADGEIYYAITSGEAKIDKKTGAFLGITGIIQDVSERKKQDDQIVYLAFHDPLTGLPNPRLFKDRLGDAIVFAERYKQKAAILCFDLDRFKRINDTLGHSAGDTLLKMVSDRLINVLRGTDCVSRLGMLDKDTPVARLGGDEFIVLLSQLTDINDVAKVATRIIEQMNVPFQLDGNEVVVTASLGISVFPSEGADVDNLLSNANSALQSAKRDGGNKYCYYETKMNSSAADKLKLEGDLRKALKYNEFLLHYQPQVNGQRGTIIGVEGLLRWQSPERGLVAPFHFIPLLEETGLIIDVGDWVLRKACVQQKQWAEEGRIPITISVNISVRQFSQVDFITRVKNIIAETGASPSLIRLEITESLLLENADSVVELLEEFRSMGFSISIDDFGTGYSSLSYLKRLPIDELKIDRSFVKDISTEIDDGTIAKTIIALAKSLQLKVIAEGVEIKEQLSFLLQQGCLNIQGFYFSKPVPVEELTIPLQDDESENSN